MSRKTAVTHPKDAHGPLSLKQARLLEPYIDVLQELADGIRPPKTPEQEQFVRVCNQKARPTTEYEIAYIKWRKSKPDLKAMLARAENAQKKFKNLNNASYQKKIQAIPSPSELIKAEQARLKRAEEIKTEPTASFPKRFVHETWGNRTSWKRDSALNKFNGR